MDLDLTAQGSQTFTSDGTYTIGAYTFTKFNSANEVTHATLSSSGITFTPASTSDYNTGKTYPGLYVDLASLLPLYDPSISVRVWAYNSAGNFSANYDNAVLSLDTGENATSYGYGYKRGYGTAGVGVATFFEYNNSNNSGFVSDLFSISSSNNVMVLEVSKLSSYPQFFSYRGSYSSGWPTLASLTIQQVWTSSSSSNNWELANGKTLKAGIGAQRSGSGTSLVVTFARLRVDYKP